MDLKTHAMVEPLRQMVLVFAPLTSSKIEYLVPFLPESKSFRRYTLVPLIHQCLTTVSTLLLLRAMLLMVYRSSKGLRVLTMTLTPYSKYKTNTTLPFSSRTFNLSSKSVMGRTLFETRPPSTTWSIPSSSRHTKKWKRISLTCTTIQILHPLSAKLSYGTSASPTHHHFMSSRAPPHSSLEYSVGQTHIIRPKQYCMEVVKEVT
mmetsp:Transcript_15693/g.33899  ORF Transcript_15693/g.33899 Transcript_15693/m.33899 type:complete len:205 (-) Transcript_15693:210-824(-)